jgi:trypsin
MAMRFALLALLVVAASAMPKSHRAPRLTDKRIVGGVDADKGEFPEQISMWLFGSHACGGTLLSATAVLTAGHCCAYPPASNYQVVVGDHVIGDGESEGTEQVLGVQEIRQHVDYDDFNLTDDICILILADEAMENENAAFATLAESGREPEDLETLVVTGWGTTSESGNLADTLQKVDVPYVPNDRCADEYGGFNDVTDGMLCAGKEEDGGVDACQGDSGGPIFFQDGAQVGLTSWGYGCARPGYPGVYTRTTYYNDWIAENMA